MREQDLPVLDTYAAAVAQAASAEGLLDAILQEAIALRRVLHDTPGLLVFLEKPAIENDRKKELLRTVFEGRLSPLMLHLAYLLVDKHRGGLWLGVVESLITLEEHRRGVYTARVATASALDAAQRQSLQECLEKSTGKKLRIQFDLRPDLIGGVFFRCGDTLIDGSLRGALDGLRVRLRSVRID
jgi:F-type H+-transporting ATPase subunit delta